MFRTVFTKTLRDYRIPILSWGLGLAIILLSIFASARDVISSGYGQVAASFAFFADLVAVNTPGGYATVRALGLFVPVILSIWTLLAGARMVRGEEERGSLDVLLSTPRSRARLLIEKILALVVALIVISVLAGLGAVVGQASAKVNVDVLGSFLASLNVSLLALFFATLALLLSQVLRSRGAAAGWAGGLLVLSFVLDGTGRVVDNGTWIRSLSPFYYYDLNKPLVSSYSAHPAAAALLLALCVIFATASIALFATRDIGGVALPASQTGAMNTSPTAAPRALERAWRNIFIRTISLRALRATLTATFWWILGMVILAGWITALVRTLESPFKRLVAGNSLYASLFGGHNIATNAGFLADLVFLLMPPIIVIFTLALALRWPTDLDDGRLELVLSTPRPRSLVILERFAAVLIPTLLALLFTWLAIIVGARLGDLSVDTGNVAAATFTILPLALIVVGLVYALAGRLRSGLVLGIATAFILVSFLLELLRDLLKLPDWVLSLSMFQQYGSPVTDGFKWQPFLGMLAVAVVLLAIGVVQFSHGDLERGA